MRPNKPPNRSNTTMPKTPAHAITEEYDMRHSDGSICRYRITVDPQEVARYLANDARTNKSRKATQCGGAVIVQCLESPNANR